MAISLMPPAPAARRADDPSRAIEEVSARFAALVRHAGRRHGLTADVLDEVAQEVRIRLWRSLGSGEKIRGAPASYVYRTAVSAALDLLRRRRAHGGVACVALTEAMHDLVDGGRLPGDRLDGETLAATVARAVDRLPLARRVAVRLHLAGHDRDEIAALAGWTEAKTRNLLYRGLADLRALLAESGLGKEDGWPEAVRLAGADGASGAGARRRAVRVASRAGGPVADRPGRATTSRASGCSTR